MVRAARAMVTAKRAAGDNEGKGVEEGDEDKEGDGDGNVCVCVCLRQLGSTGSVVIMQFQSLPLAPGKVLPICITTQYGASLGGPKNS